MRCTKVREKLVPYLDKELNDKYNLLILRHLKECVECQEEIGKLALLNTALGKQDELEVPFGFSRRVLNRLAEGVAKKPQWEGFPWLLQVPTIAQVAAMGVVVLLGIHLGMTFPWADRESKKSGVFQWAEFDELAEASVEGEYLAFCLTLSSDKEG